MRRRLSAGKMGAMGRRGGEGAEETGEPKRGVLISRPVASLTLAMLASAFGFQLLLSVCRSTPPR